MSDRKVRQGETKIGLGEVKITPPLGVKMAGFSARKGVSQGVHDDLYARALVVEDQGTAVAILSASVLYIAREVIDGTRKEIAQRTGLPEAHIIIAATHTHSGPTNTEEYNAYLKEKCVECLLAAWESRTESRLGIGTCHVEGVGRNRRRLDYGGLPVDPEVGIIRVESQAGKISGVLLNYACHPTTMGPRNLLISEDWVYYTTQAIKEEIGDDTVVMFVNGAEGDINPGYGSGLSAVGAYIPIRTWEYTEKIGRILGRAVLDALPEIETESSFPIQSVSEEISLPLRRSFPMTLEQAEEELKKRKETFGKLKEQKNRVSQVLLDRTEAEAYYANQTRNSAKWFYSEARKSAIEVELQSILLGDTALTTFPGEVFVEIGLEVKRRSPFPRTFVIGVAGPATGYLPTGKAFSEGDYEVCGAKYSAEAAQVLIEATLEQLRKLTPGSG
ncbi:neutral/alkaline non-lysosomal ceramidase N-terminal domain-containing protein [Candidatus Poribacteria bacterium]